MSFITTAIVAYRNFSFSTKSIGEYKKWYMNKNKTKKSEPRNPRTRIKWTDEQKNIISAISEGKSVFITGSAGTGKTLLLQHIIKVLKKRHQPSRVFATASTGVAACGIRGQTLHSFAGIGCRMPDRHALLDRVLKDYKAYRRWKRVEALVIDEASMVDAEMFESLQCIAKVIRNKNEVWGGIQLVVCGDFFQLPPVLDPRNPSGKEYAFEADCWNASFDMLFELTHIFRQSDPRLVKLLQGIRRGECDPQELEVLQNSSGPPPDGSVIELYPLKEDVNRVNVMRMQRLCERVIKYSAVDSGENYWKGQLKQGIAADEVLLSEGARVMLIKNLNPWRGLVNGATGTVIGFCESEDVRNICCENVAPIVKFDSGRTMVIEPEKWDVMEGDAVVAERKQVPLLLAWAVSIHKCQGMSFDKLYTDLSRAFGCGMVYVALSRVRTLEGLQLSGFKPSKIKAHPKVLEFYKSNFCNEQSIVELEGNENIDGANNIGGGSQGATKYHFSLSEFLSSRQSRE